MKLIFLVLVLILGSVVADGETSCHTGIVGYRDELICYWNVCYTIQVPVYGWICPEPLINITTTITTQESPKSNHQDNVMGHSYTFGKNDVDRYKILKSQNNSRSKYFREIIAWENGFYTIEKFEKKYNII